jgi:hypothetical protein
MNYSKHIILTFSVIAFLNIYLSAQNTYKGEFGLRFMPTVSVFDIQTSAGGKISGDATVGLGFGAFIGLNFTDHIGVQAEVIYSKLTQKYVEQDLEREINLEYINIPLLLSYNTGKNQAVNFNIVAGPQIGLSVGSELFTANNGDPDNQAVLSVKKGDLGFAYGAGFDFGLNANRTFRLGLGFRGVYGLFDISDNSNSLTTDNYYVLDRTKLKTYSAYAGVSFLF